MNSGIHGENQTMHHILVFVVVGWDQSMICVWLNVKLLFSDLESKGPIIRLVSSCIEAQNLLGNYRAQA